MGEVLLVCAFFAVLGLYDSMDSTLWAPSYREETFRHLPIGATKEEVLCNLGYPLQVHLSTSKIWPSPGEGRPLTDEALRKANYWFYTSPGRKIGDVSYRIRAVIFDSKGRLVSKEVRSESD